MHRKPAGALAIVLALVVGACGSSSESLSSAQLRTQANAVCKDVRTQIEAIKDRSTAATLQTSLSRTAAVITDGIDRLEGLDPPDRLADPYARFLAWKKAQRDAALQLSKPHGRLSAREDRAVESHSPIGTIGHQLGLARCE